MQIVRTYFLSRVKKLSLQHICRTKPTSYIMLIALLPILLIICAILLLSYLWERRKCLRMQKRLFRESRKLEHTNHIASAILKNVHAYILLIDNDFKVLKTNYYQLTGTQKGLEEKRGRLIAMPQRIIGGRRLRYSCLLWLLPHTLCHPPGFRTKKRLH